MFSGCGGGGGGSNTTNNASANTTSNTPIANDTITSQFIDAPVEGLSYSCSSGLSGLTNKNGEYTCKKDDKVTFSIGSVLIGSAEVNSEPVTPYTLFPNSLDASLNLARLLQTVDSDGDPSNGIKLDETKVSQLPSSTNFKSTSFVKEVEQKLNETLVSRDTAKQHMDDTIASVGKNVKTLESYDYSSVLNYAELKSNPKKVFYYMKDVYKYLDDSSHLSQINKCYYESNSEVCATYMMNLGSKSLYYFMKIGESSQNLKELKKINFRYTFSIFSKNAYEEYVTLKNNIRTTLSKLVNKGLIKVSYDTMSSQYGANFGTRLMGSIYNYPSSLSDYYFPMTAYRVSNLGTKDIDTLFSEIKSDIESTYSDTAKKQEAYKSAVQLSKDIESYMLSRSPKIPSIKDDKEIQNLLKSIDNRTKNFMSDYLQSDFKGDIYKELTSIPIVSYVFNALEVYETFTTVKGALNLAENTLDDTLLWYDRTSDMNDIEKCTSSCGGSSEKNSRWFLNSNTINDKSKFYVPLEIYNEFSNLNKWRGEFESLAGGTTSSTTSSTSGAGTSTTTSGTTSSTGSTTTTSTTTGTTSSGSTGTTTTSGTGTSTTTTTPSTTSTSTVKKTGQTKSYYSKDDGYYQKGVTPRYTRASDTVTDDVTKLMWQDDVAAKTVTKTWADAKTYCQNLTLSGYTDWRLPTSKELRTIVDYGKSYPAIDTTYFKNVSSYYYWSSTTFKSSTSLAWYVYFYNGYVGRSDKNRNFYVRCVRDGQ